MHSLSPQARVPPWEQDRASSGLDYQEDRPHMTQFSPVAGASDRHRDSCRWVQSHCREHEEFERHCNL